MAIATFILAYFFFFPAAMLLAFPAGLGATAYIVILSGFLFTRFARGQWQHIRIFEEDAVATE